MAALDEALFAAEIPKVGLFLIGHPSSLSTGRAVWDYAWHEREGDLVPLAKARAYVDVETGDVTPELYPRGAPAWTPER